MKVILSPKASNYTTTVSINNQVVTVDGIDYDLSAIPVGGQAEASEDSPFVGIITRDEVTVKYSYDSQVALPDQSKDWADYTFEMTTGDVPCPIIWKPVVEETDVL
jgi:hypothetical protein